jgi:hypothetical protein
MLLNRLRALAVVTILAAVCPTASLAQTTPTPVPAPDPSAPFFDDSALHDIYLAMNSRDWESLKVNYLANTYYPADLKWRDQTVRNIGVRSRGHGSRSGVKPGLRIDTNYYTAGQEFLGLKSFILRNNTQDASGLRERLSMLMFRRMEVPAEREADTRLFVNNVYAGLYTIVESVDKTFLKKNYGENDGHLYEYSFDDALDPPFAFGYPGSDPALYVPLPFKPQTLENDPQGEVIERLFWTINNAGDAIWRTAIEEFLDLKKFIRQLAIENFLAEEDGITGDYGPNNFYFYRFQNTNRFIFIPWDKSNAFWESPAYSIFRNIEDGPENRRNRLVLRAFKDTDLRELYLQTMLDCADSVLADPLLTPTTSASPVPAAPLVPAAPGRPGWLETEVGRQSAQIRAAAIVDPLSPYSPAQFEQSIVDLTTFARQRSEQVRLQVAADRAGRGIR